MVKNNAGERIIVPVYIEATYDYYNVSLGKIKRELDNEVKTVYGKGKIYSYLNNYIKKGDLKTIEINKRAISNGAVQSRTGTNSSLITRSIPSLNTDVNSQYMQNGQIIHR